MAKERGKEKGERGRVRETATRLSLSAAAKTIAKASCFDLSNFTTAAQQLCRERERERESKRELKSEQHISCAQGERELEFERVALISQSRLGST